MIVPTVYLAGAVVLALPVLAAVAFTHVHSGPPARHNRGRIRGPGRPLIDLGPPKYAPGTAGHPDTWLDPPTQLPSLPPDDTPWGPLW